MPEIPSPHGGTSSSLDGETLDCRLLELRNASSDEHDDRGEMSDESDGKHIERSMKLRNFLLQHVGAVARRG
ncbi:hypothetical protein L484_019778 [Morus notabilis]|uniref:Uncharacterized protein n=1 Tax=Morus notabilis TaxID=981085 RepID=W9RTK5_9ROSA|nr:hypothetical protein L484_019778 [Morus notabilis]